jgi:hypothetical protein
MDRDNRYIPRVIENAETCVRRTHGRRFDLSPRQLLYYNDHPDAIIEDFDRSEYGSVLREIERRVIDGYDVALLRRNDPVVLESSRRCGRPDAR